MSELNRKLTVHEKLCELYKDYMLEFLATVNGIVQLSGHSNSGSSLLIVQYDSQDVLNHGIVIRSKPKFYLNGEDQYAHITYISAIKNPLKIYIACEYPGQKPKLVYTQEDGFISTTRKQL